MPGEAACFEKAYGYQRGLRDKAVACGNNGLVSTNGQFEAEASTTYPAGSRYESKSYGGTAAGSTRPRRTGTRRPRPT